MFAGMLSLVQMSRLKLFGGYYLGTGLITVVGTSFATLSTANAVRHPPHNVLSPHSSDVALTGRYSMSCTRTGHVHPPYLVQELSFGDLVLTLMANF
jgi:hypothetical protein